MWRQLRNDVMPSEEKTWSKTWTKPSPSFLSTPVGCVGDRLKADDVNSNMKIQRSGLTCSNFNHMRLVELTAPCSYTVCPRGDNDVKALAFFKLHNNKNVLGKLQQEVYSYKVNHWMQS